MLRVRIHRLVDFEFREIRAWYAGLSPLAAENFADCFDEALARLRKHPTAHAPWRIIFRRVRLKRFPYLLLFHADRRTISILAVVHERRKPRQTFTDVARRQNEFL